MILFKTLSITLLLTLAATTYAVAETPAPAPSPEQVGQTDGTGPIVPKAEAKATALQALCPQLPAKPKAYAIGSSTMGSVLGPILKNAFKKEGFALNRWGKASSGLARPDFHDWPKKAPGLMAKHKPQIVVVSLGTNDFQPLYHKKKWVKWGVERWEKIYAARVDRMLKTLGGKKKQRLVLWTGPTSFKGKKAQARGPHVNRIMKERVAAYVAQGGRALFLDAYAKTTNSKGKPLMKAKLPGYKRTKSIRTHDGIHMTVDAVRALMADPIMDVVRQCNAVQAKRDAIGAKAAAEKATVGTKNGG